MMNKHKRLYQSLLRSLLALITLCMTIACAPAGTLMTHARYQKAMELIDQGTMQLRVGKIAEAEGSFSTAVSLGRIAAAVDGLGCVAFKRGEFRLAEKYFIEALDMDKQYSRALGNLALLYQINGLSDEALKFYRTALMEEPENYQARNNLAVHLFLNTDKKESKIELFKALSLAKHPIIAANLDKLEQYE